MHVVTPLFSLKHAEYDQSSRRKSQFLPKILLRAPFLSSGLSGNLVYLAWRGFPNAGSGLKVLSTRPETRGYLFASIFWTSPVHSVQNPAMGY
jgi:hypothetical protein